MPNTRVTPLRIRVWIIEVGALVLIMSVVIWQMATALNNEKQRATKSEETVLISGCHRINKNAKAINDNTTDVRELIEFAVVNPATGLPYNERGAQLLQRAREGFTAADVIDCSKIPARLRE